MLGHRVVEILETGRRTATYKLATLMALVDHCIEHLPEGRDDTLEVPIRELAEQVMDLYWYQVLCFDRHLQLRQPTGGATIVAAVLDFRAASGVGQSRTTLDVAKSRNLDAYRAALDTITITLAEQPLRRLQRIRSVADPFLYDDSFLDEHMSAKKLAVHGGAITLKAGVAHGLARLSGLLKPALQSMWVSDVRRINVLDDEVLDIEGHLFGRARVDLTPVQTPFKQAFGPYCFYCEAELKPGNPVDHVLPWSSVGLDGLQNLVLACMPCNSDKSNKIPALQHVDKALEDTDRANKLDRIETEIRWPTQRKRVRDAARGLYQTEPPGLPTWLRRGQTIDLDTTGDHPRLRAGR